MGMTLDLNQLQVALDGETDIIVRRDFSHPPARVAGADRARADPQVDGVRKRSQALRDGSAAERQLLP